MAGLAGNETICNSSLGMAWRLDGTTVLLVVALILKIENNSKHMFVFRPRNSERRLLYYTVYCREEANCLVKDVLHDMDILC